MDRILQRILYYSGLILIALWLFTIHTSFAYSLNPITGNIFFSDLFIFNELDLKPLIPYIWGGTFSLGISAIIAILSIQDKYFWQFSLFVAFLELIGIALLNMPTHNNLWSVLSSIYYGIYAFALITFYFYVKPKMKPENFSVKSVKFQNSRKEISEEDVVKLLKSKVKGKDISMKFNISQSKISRIKKRNEI